MSKLSCSFSVMAAAMLLVSSSSMAATASVAGTVTKVFVDGGVSGANYGGCMAALSVSPTTKLASCAANWVTFSCTGTFATNTAQAYHLLDQAQLALAANKRVTVYFRDDKKHNGYCFAYRVEVIK